MNNEVLYHHGIKGMKWGRRRFQNEDGSLTPAGEKRYAADQRVAETKAEYKNAKKAYQNSYGEAYNKSMSGLSPVKKHRDANKARWDDADKKAKVMRKAKVEYESAKLERKEVISETKEKSNHRQNLEAKYREQGMNEQQAAAAADKRIRTEQAIAVVGGVTVAAATAYLVNKHMKNNVDQIIKSGSTMQRITRTPDESLDRAFYSSYKKVDNLKYRGMMGSNHFKGDNVHKVTLTANSDVKVASRKKAAEAFADLYKNDSEFRDAYNKTIGENEHGFAFMGLRGLKNMSDKDLRGKGYDAMNIGLVNRSEAGSTVSRKFYDKMKSMGYDAVHDINDQKYSGYNAKAPVIVFNNSGKLTRSSTTKMTNREMHDDLMKSYGYEIAKDFGKKAAAGVGVGVAARYAASTATKIQIDNYRIQHPNTKLSDAEIMKMLYGGQQ